MAQETNQEELAMRYLLRTLSEEERARVEEDFFADDREFEEIEIAEEVLIDRYVRGELARTTGLVSSSSCFAYRDFVSESNLRDCWPPELSG